MNPRQRRAILLLALAVAGLVGVFILVANYVGNVETEVGEKIIVLELTKPVPANAAISDAMVSEKVIPRRWAPTAALTDRTQLVGYVASAALQPNSILQEGMLESPPQIKPGQREVAILVDASTGVAGRISAGSHVDVIAAYGGQDNKPGVTNRTEVIVPGAQVLAVGQPQPKGANGVQEAQQNPSEVVPVTFALTKRQELKVAHAQTFAADVRLALLPEGDDGSRTLGETIYKGQDPKRGDDEGKIQ